MRPSRKSKRKSRAGARIQPVEKRRLHSPFIGLIPYDAASSRYFCGRDREVQLVTANAITRRLSVFFGPSGSGKSSVLCAGVIPELTASARTRRIVVLLREEWAADPWSAVNQQIRQALGGQILTFPDAWLPKPEEPEESSSEEAEESVSNVNSDKTVSKKVRCPPQLILLLDQFEDLFVQCPAVVSTPPGRMLELALLLQEGRLPPALEPGVRFAAALIALLNQPSASVNVVFSLREDCLADLDVFKGVLPGLFDTLLRIDQLDESAVRVIIDEALSRWSKDTHTHCNASPDLVQAILDDPGLQVGRRARTRTTVRYETAFLQLTLESLWLRDALHDDPNAESPKTVLLAKETFTSLGLSLGIRRAFVDETLDRELANPTERRWFIESSRYLVSPTQKFPWIVSELRHSICPVLKEAGTEVPSLNKLSNLFRKLQKARLMREVQLAGAPVEEGDARFEMAHDSLAGPVVTWREREDVKLCEALRAEELAEGRRIAEERSAEKRRIHDEAAAAAELRVKAAGAQMRKLVAIFAVITVAMLVLLVFVEHLVRTAKADRDQAEAMAERAQAEAETAKADAASAKVEANAARQKLGDIFSNREGIQTESQLLRQRLQELHTKLDLATSELDENSSLTSKTLKVLDSAKDEIVRTSTEISDTIKHTIGDPDSTLIVAGKARCWDTSEPSLKDTPLALVTSWDQADLLDVFKSGAPRGRFPTVDALDPTKKFIAGRWNYNDSPRAWLLGTRVLVRNRRNNLTTEAQPVDWGPGPSTGAVMDLSPALFKALGFEEDNHAEYVLDKVRPAQIAVLRGHTAALNTAVFGTAAGRTSSDLIATAGKDNRVMLWDTAGKNLAKTPGDASGHGIRTVAFVPGHNLLLTGGTDRFVRLWEFGDGRLEQRAAQENNAMAMQIEFAPEKPGLGLICRHSACSVFQFPLKDQGPSTWLQPTNVLGDLPGTGQELTWASFSSDGDFIVTSSDTGRVGVFQSTKPFNPVATTPASNPAELKAPARQLVFSPNGSKRVIAGGLGAKVMLWRAEQGGAICVLDQTKGRQFFHAGGVVGVAFNDDGSLMASIGTDGQCILWNVQPKDPVPLRLVPHDLKGRLLAVDWHGGLLALGGEDGGLEIWTVIKKAAEAISPSPALVVTRRFAEQAHRGTTGGLSFSPDGLRLITWSGVLHPGNITPATATAANWATKQKLTRSDNTAVLWDVHAAVNSGKTRRD